jgi:hypothetical protein
VPASDVQDRFNLINLHDCKLLAVHLESGKRLQSDTVRLELRLVSGPEARQWIPGELTFVRCAAFAVKIDLWAKVAVASDMAATTCTPATQAVLDALTESTRQRWDQPLAELFLFRLALVEPGGELSVIASDFEMTPLSYS